MGKSKGYTKTFMQSLNLHIMTKALRTKVFLTS